MLPPSPVPATASPLPVPLCDTHTDTPVCHQRRSQPNTLSCHSALSASRVLPLGDGAERVPCPWVALAAFAPAISSLVGPPGAVLAIAELHLHAMRATPAFGLCL